MRLIKYTMFFSAIAGMLTATSQAATVNISGTIYDSLTHKGISNATVTLKYAPSITAVTDANGAYTLSGTTSVIASKKTMIEVNPVVRSSGVYFSIAGPATQTRFDLYTLQGEKVATIVDKELGSGRYRVDPAAAGFSDQFYFAKIRIGAEQYFVKLMQIARHSSSSFKTVMNIGSVNKALYKSSDQTALDTIIVTALKHRTMRTALTSLNGTMNFTIRSSNLQALTKVVSVSQKGLTAGLGKRLDAPSWTEPSFNPGFINAGAPDYMYVQLTRIILKNDSLKAGTAVWEGSKTFKLTGAGTVDVGDMVLDSFPTWNVTTIELWFNDSATIKGTLTGIFNMDTTGTKFDGQTKTYYTKNAYGYYAGQCVGGADSTVGRAKVFETAPAESCGISLMASKNGIAMITTATSFTYDTTQPAPALTILFDLNRVLRFYNGCSQNGGPNAGNDPLNRALFFDFSVFPNSIAAYFGTPGQIQGYETVYNCSGGNCGVKGWMTLIFAADSSIMSGVLIGNDDNDFCISKGMVRTSTKTNSTWDFSYDISKVDVTGFTKGVALGDSSIAVWTKPGVNGAATMTGQAKYSLRFITK
jgi:hypothetical protein